MGTVKAHTRLKDLNETGAKLLILVPGAGVEPARSLAAPRDFKSRVSTNFTIRACGRTEKRVLRTEFLFYGPSVITALSRVDYTTGDGNENSGLEASRCGNLIRSRRRINHPAASCGLSRGPQVTFPRLVTLECFNRGSSPNFAWIPAKNMRE